MVPAALLQFLSLGNESVKVDPKSLREVMSFTEESKPRLDSSGLSTCGRNGYHLHTVVQIESIVPLLPQLWVLICVVPVCIGIYGMLRCECQVQILGVTD